MSQKLIGSLARPIKLKLSLNPVGSGLEDGRVFIGQEFTWNEDAVKGTKADRNFQFILSEDGEFIHGAKAEIPLGLPIPWWGVSDDSCETNASAWKKCGYPK